MHHDFRPARWLPGPHLSTLWPALLRSPPPMTWRRERLELPDGDFLDLDWGPTSPGPRVLILHGLEGSSRSGHVAGLAAALTTQGFEVVVMHFRGCSGEPNRLRHSYHAGISGEIQGVTCQLAARQERPFYVVGFSLGGNVLLKWLGETPFADITTNLRGAVAISVPFRLAVAAERLNRGLSRLYQGHLLKSLCRSYRRKFSQRDDPPLPLEQVSRLGSLRDFDQHITAPLHGFKSAEQYYQVASCSAYLANIRHPVLIIQARNDPFSEAWVIPEADSLPANILVECHEQGGHVGFVEGKPWCPGYYLERRIPHWLQQQQQALNAN